MLCVMLAVATGCLAYVVATGPTSVSEGEKSVAEKASTLTQPRPNEAPSGEVALEAKGYIIPARLIQVSPKVNGMVMKLDVVEGKRVKEGDILCVLEDIDYKADHARAEAT